MSFCKRLIVYRVFKFPSFTLCNTEVQWNRPTYQRQPYIYIFLESKVRHDPERYREFLVHRVAGPRHPTQSETNDDVDHRFRHVDFRLRQSRGTLLVFSLIFRNGL